MELAGQLSFISVGIGIVLVILGLIKYFRQRAEEKRQRQERHPPDGKPL